MGEEAERTEREVEVDVTESEVSEPAVPQPDEGAAPGQEPDESGEAQGEPSQAPAESEEDGA